MVVLTDVHENIAAVFQDAANSDVNHRKNLSTLRKLLARLTVHDFADAFIANVNVLLASKKRGPVTERVSKFILAFVKFACEKGIFAIFPDECH